MVSIPFGGPKLKDCSNLLAMEEARNRLQLAMTLYEAGGLSATELQEVVKDTAQLVK